MTSLPSMIGADFVRFHAGGTRRWQGAFEQRRFKIRQVIALRAYHLFQPSMQLYRPRPRAFHSQRYVRHQRRERGIDAIDVLGVQSHESSLAG